MLADTIFALSSGSLPSGVAVIRISGPSVKDIAASICGGAAPDRRATLRTIRTRNGERLDEGLVLFFEGPKSFTGEDCLELHIHGGRAVVNAVLDELSGYDHVRHAEAGEFSKRAFLHGKLDLVEVEGLADLIAAETEMQRRLASEQSRGALSSLYSNWARRLTHARAMIEAELDFADEEDVPGAASAAVWEDMLTLQNEITAHLEGAKSGEIIRDGFQIVIVGPPNAGKSSLLNALAKRDAAIVTEIAGTTRDLVTVDFSLAGFAVRLIDTAGLRETEDAVELEGIRRAKDAAENAHLILSLSPDQSSFIDLEGGNAQVVRIATKIDQRSDSWDRDPETIGISTRSGAGLDRLLDRLVAALPQVAGAQSLVLPARRRQRDHLEACVSSLKRALDENSLDVQAEFLRQATDALGRITGRVDVEHLLDVIFSEFCIGK